MKTYFKWIKESKTTSFDICFVLGTGWNALHEALPVLVWIKEHYRDVNILSIVGENNAKEQSALNKTYYEMLLKYSDALILQEWMQIKFYPLRRLHLSIHKKIYKKYMPIQMGDLLQNVTIKNVMYADSQLPVFRYLYNKYPKNKGVRYFNTGEVSFDSMSFLPPDYQLGPEFTEFPSVYFAKDKMFADKITKIKGLKIVLSGSPKFDPWWVGKIRGLHSKKISIKTDDERLIAIALPKLDDGGIRLNKNEEEQLLSYIKYNIKNDYIFAFHPRDDERIRKKFMQKLQKKYRVWDGDLMSLSEAVDVLIYVGTSTGQADCIVTEKPLILFYDDYKQHEFLYRLPGGKFGDYFHLKDIVPHARSAEELRDKVNECLNGGWEAYKDRYKKYIPRLPACKIIADCILGVDNVKNSEGWDG